jgi:hypothetical protein
MPFLQRYFAGYMGGMSTVAADTSNSCLHQCRLRYPPSFSNAIAGYEVNKHHLGFEDLTAVATKSRIFWDMTSQSTAEVYLLSSETSANFYHTAHHIPDDSNLQQLLCPVTFLPEILHSYQNLLLDANFITISTEVFFGLVFHF